MSGFEGFTQDYSGLPKEYADYLKKNGIRILGFENKRTWEFTSLEDIYNRCIYIRAIVDKKAECARNIKLRLFKTDPTAEDVEIFSHPVLDLMNNPNPLQSLGDWYAQRLVQQTVYGKSFIRGVKGRTNDFINSKALWNLPPVDVQVIEYLNGVNDMYSRFTIDEIVDYFRFTSRSGLVELQPEEVLMWMDFTFKFNDCSINNDRSEFSTLKESASNLMAIQEARGELIKHMGAVGILSPNAGSDATGTTMVLKDPKTKADLLSGIKKLYGIVRGQSKIMQADIPLQWQQMATDVAKLQLTQQEQSEFNVCCDLLQVPRALFDDKSTFNNQEEAKKKLYTDVVIPWCNSETQRLNAKFGLNKMNLELRSDFTHLEILQDDLSAKEDVETKKTDRVIKLVDKGMLTKDTAVTELGYDPKDMPKEEKEVETDKTVQDGEE